MKKWFAVLTLVIGIQSYACLSQAQTLRDLTLRMRALIKQSCIETYKRNGYSFRADDIKIMRHACVVEYVRSYNCSDKYIVYFEGHVFEKKTCL